MGCGLSEEENVDRDIAPVSHQTVGPSGLASQPY